MLKLAFRNVFRHAARTALTLIAVAFGVAGLIVSGGFVHDIFLQLGEAVIHSSSGHLQVSPKGFQDLGSGSPGAYLIGDPEPLRSRISALPGVSDAILRVSFAGLLGNGRTDLAVLGQGIEPSREARLGTYMRIVAGRMLRDGEHGIMLGSGVARALKLAPGDRTTLMVSTSEGATNTVDVDVVGVFQTFSKDYDARAVRIPLEVAHEALDNAGANTVVIALARTDDTNATADLLRGQLASEGYELWTWHQLNDFYAKTVDLYDRQFAVLRLIILVMVVLSTANSVNMTVFERVGEFGTMRALGNRTLVVFRLIATESLLLGVIGAAAGLVLGVAVAWALSAIGIPMPPPPNAEVGYTARVQLVPGVIAGAVAVGIAATTIAGTLAAWRASRIPVVDALRRAV